MASVPARDPVVELGLEGMFFFEGSIDDIDRILQNLQIRRVRE
jgi:hypothetical protein